MLRNRASEAGSNVHGAISRRLAAIPPRRWLVLVLVGFAFLLGSLLRFEAFHHTYGPLDAPALLIEAQESLARGASHLRPYEVDWERGRYPYRFDPKSYLDSAREMDHFYEARLREPLFVAVTRILLAFTGGQDIAVSLGSVLMSCLVILATFWLGKTIAGSTVGIVSAVLVAIEPQLIDWSARGYRAELFTLTTVAFAVGAILMGRRPTVRRGLFTGIVGGLACLTRITSLSFVLPTLLFVGVVRQRDEIPDALRTVLVAALVTALLIGPFLIACWLQFGDPLYSISSHTSFYRGRAGVDQPEAVGVMDYIVQRLLSQPVRRLDGIARGLTIYPWENKWGGYRRWSPYLETALRYLSIVGVLAWLWRPPGRIALVVLGTALLPFAFTWEVFQDWRFTMHAYPFLIVAAVDAAGLPARAMTGWRRGPRSRGWLLRRIGVPVAGSALVIALAVGLHYGAPPLIFYQQLDAGDAASVAAGERDVLFFVDGWLPPRKEGNVVFRYGDGDESSIRFPMPGSGPYRALIRMDPAPRLAGDRLSVSLRINGVWSHRVPLPHGDQVGRHEFSIPVGVLEPGLNHIEILADEPLRRRRRLQEAPSAFRFWYIRFWPESPE